MPTPEEILATANLTTSGSGTESSGSFVVEIDLQELLSLAGIEPEVSNLLFISGSNEPTGSVLDPLIPPPLKIRFKDIEGIVVDSVTNEPLSGVKVKNKFLKKDTTNEKGEFKIKHPDIEKSGLPPNKFQLTFKKRKYSTPFELTPYTSVNELKLNLGIIPISPKESSLKKDIQEFLTFDKLTEEEYATSDTTVNFTTQKKLNKSIDDLKATVYPMILLLIAAYGISEAKKYIEENELNKESLLEELKDVITCPTKDELSKIIDQKNKLVKIINQILNVINSTTEALTISGTIIGITSTVLKIVENIPIPTAILGVGIPINVINKIQDVIKFLSQLIPKLSIINTVLLSILKLLQLTLTQVLQALNLLDSLTQYCYEEDSSQRRNREPQLQISAELTALTTNQSTKQTSPVIVNVNGFKMGVETEITEKSLKRRRAIARNAGGIVMLTGEWSFSSIDQILIDELVFYIQQNDLKAD